MKNVYVCYGSEDGVIGVYSNKKLAYAKAKEYVGEPDLTYGQVCKTMVHYDRVEVEVTGEDASCRIMKEVLNDKY
tara:strand:+ start:1146 stop:1370 length:225 start_codon:yes stop_codon:yes gene_type:complete